MTELLGRPPRGAFTVVVRHRDGSPVVIENAPLLADATPMPTRYWLLGEPERTWVGRLESEGGVRQAEAEIDPRRLAAAHTRYAAERDSHLPAGHRGPRPSGGVGGTRRGVKCLHAHFAWWLAGGDDPVGDWVGDRLAADGYVVDVVPPRSLDRRNPGSDDPAEAAPVAAIDCGTNSTRLLIARHRAGGGVATVVRRMRITRLGQGVDATGRLERSAIARTLEVLRDYREDMDANGVATVRATATSAARDAANRDDFFEPAAASIGVVPELLTGTEEGTLSFTGATADLADRPGRYLVVDIGGGSTEFAAGTVHAGGSTTIDGVESVDIGCVRITERFLPTDPPTADEWSSAADFATNVIDGVLDRVAGARQATTLVGLAGTVSALASIDQGLTAYDAARIHHHVLTAPRIAELTGMLLKRSASQRRAVPGMEPQRADVILGGLVVVQALLARTGHTEVLVSESDILDGLAASLLWPDRG